MKKGDIIADFFKIAHDMRRHQNCVVFIPRKFTENVKDLISDDRIQSAGRLIQNKKLGIMRQRYCDTQFHLHTA